MPDPRLDHADLVDPGAQAELTGRSGDWWQILYNDAPGWVFGELVTAHDADQVETPSTTPLAPTEPSSADVAAWPAEVFRLINGLRAENGLSPYTYNEMLEQAAQLHGQDCQQRGSCSHTGSDGSNVKVEKVYSGIDVGPILNLSGAKNQVEGAVVDALSTAQLEITFANGAARQSNFNDYGLLRVGQAPEVECHFIQSDNSPSGLGEPPFAAATPAITNAIFAATEKRIRALPFSRSGVVV